MYILDAKRQTGLFKTAAPVTLIWESWRDGAGQALETFSILTTGANSLMAPIHERMPVILHCDDFDTWLDRTISDPQKLQRLYQPYPSEMMQSWQVSKLVNSPAHDAKECVRPLLTI